MSEVLEVLLSDGVIEEIIGRLKSGKEADVYLVVHGGEIVAAKIYKERDHRNFRNNADYKEGRQVRNSRTARAIAKGSRFGQAAAEDAWKTAEADALYKLYDAGVRVPKPVMYYEGVLLMEVVVDPEGHPAPRLIDAPLSAEQASAMYRDLRAQATRMLCSDVIHGDLSPYNILMGWNGPNIIDFPQTVNAAASSRAEFFFKRDIENLRRFFAGMDPSLQSRGGDAHELWRAYTKRELTPDFEPSGRSVPPEERRVQGPPREQRGPPREHRGPPRDNSGPPREHRGPPRDNSGPPREHRGPPREHRGPPRDRVDTRPPAPPQAAPSPAAAPEEDEFALLRQGGGERPRVQDAARQNPGHRSSRGGPPREHRGPPRDRADARPPAPPRAAPEEDEFALLRQGGGERPRVQDLARQNQGHRSPRGGPQHGRNGGGGAQHGRGGPGGSPNGRNASGGAPNGRNGSGGPPQQQRGPRQQGQDRPNGAPRAHSGPPRAEGQGARQGGGRDAGPRQGRSQGGPLVSYVPRQSPTAGQPEATSAPNEGRAPESRPPMGPSGAGRPGDERRAHSHRRRG
ncbi:hypothetical protein P2318_15990 [Myxococcaceae bacterium GXIMD 01537]